MSKKMEQVLGWLLSCFSPRLGSGRTPCSSMEGSWFVVLTAMGLTGCWLFLCKGTEPTRKEGQKVGNKAPGAL